MTRIPHISVVLPVFNERELLSELHRRLTAVLAGMPVTSEIVLVNDGSSDGSWDRMLEIANVDRSVKALNLSRNFGHQVAITAGLDAASGDAVVVMDSDLQDPPEVIPLMYAKFLEGYDVAYGQRRQREGETWVKKATAKLFYRLVRRLTNLDIPADTGDFRLMSRRVVDDLARFQEHHRFIRGLVTWVGYNQTPVLYDRDRRYGGATKFSIGRMITFAFDGITSMSIRPLRLASHLGLLLSMLSGVAMIFLVIYKLSGAPSLVQGWTSLAVAMLFLGGVQLLALGLMGEYLGRIHDEVKQRPAYLIRDRFNLGAPHSERRPHEHAS
jgi:glycosyltransferase involved in cell wall biosynthesis